MRIRPKTAALVMVGGLGLAACGGATTSTGAATVTSRPTRPAPTAAPPTTAASPAPAGPVVSDADLAQIDQQLADAGGPLTAADQDATHDESGDANP